jgi:hypothetical protein
VGMPPRELTAKDFADWLTPSQAVEILSGVFADDYLSKRTLLGRLTGGMVQAAAQHAVIDDSVPLRRVLLYVIPSSDWNEIETTDTFWITGDLIYRRRSYGGIGETTYSHYGVKFEPQEVRAIIANAPSPTPTPQKIQAPSGANKGGRPRKDWWDDF